MVYIVKSSKLLLGVSAIRNWGSLMTFLVRSPSVLSAQCRAASRIKRRAETSLVPPLSRKKMYKLSTLNSSRDWVNSKVNNTLNSRTMLSHFARQFLDVFLFLC